MKNNRIQRIVSIGALSVCSMTLWAQYPIIPDSVKQRVARQTAEFEARADAAWSKALPRVLAQSDKGRPFVPWASKPEHLIKSDIPAFPGAEGGGAFTPGGRGGDVYVVTSLENDGPGTLREACEAGGARIIVFNVAGVIKLSEPISLRAPYVTIAGQTAPGDGVCLSGASFLIDTHDVVIRHMRFRRGQVDVGFRDDALGGNAVGNIIIDHCSASWGLDEVMSIYRHVYKRDKNDNGLKLPTVNITIQNSMFAEGLDTYNHAFGATIGGHNSMFARNLFASNISRNSSVGMNGGFNFVNNVVYNWWNRSVDGGDNTSQYNIINNYYKPGPITPKDQSIAHRIIKPEAGRDKRFTNVYGTAFVDGNIVEGNPIVTKENWKGGVQIKNAPNADGYEDKIRVNQPHPMPFVTLMSSKEAYRYVLKNVGAIFPVRDAVDERIIKTVKTGKAIYAKDAKPYTTPFVKRRLAPDSYKQGIITHPDQVGGLPEYKGNPVKDTDNDGMPDEWELKYGLNPNDASDASSDLNKDGYTNIEKYINGIDPTKRIDWKNPENNYDTLSDRKSLIK